MTLHYFDEFDGQWQTDVGQADDGDIGCSGV